MRSPELIRYLLLLALLFEFSFVSVDSDIITSKEDALAQQTKIAEEMWRVHVNRMKAYREAQGLDAEDEEGAEEELRAEGKGKRGEQKLNSSSRRWGLDEPNVNDELSDMYMEIKPEKIEGINDFDKMGNTPLINAVIAGHFEVTNNFIKAGADVNLPSLSGEYPIVLAAERGLYHCTKALLEAKADPRKISQGENSQNLQGGKSALVVAVVIGHSEIIDLLVEHGADVNQILPTSQSVLMIASSTLSIPKEDHASIVNKLASNGADVNFQDANSSTALMFASSSGSTHVVKALIAQGANVNSQNEEGSSALMFACTRGHVETARTLLDAGADINAMDASGLSVLALVFEFTPDYLQSDTLSLLVERGVNTQHFNVLGMVPKESIQKRKVFLKAKQREKLERERIVRMEELEEGARKIGKWKDYKSKVLGGGAASDEVMDARYKIEVMQSIQEVGQDIAVKVEGDTDEQNFEAARV